MSETTTTETTTALERLQRPPIIDRIDPQTLALIKSSIAPTCSAAEIGYFLELCALYDLDPFAHEAWIAKSQKGLLIMVGRDGLRKIAARNGLHVDGDTVHAKDDFHIVRTPNGNRTVAHSYGLPAERGEVVGAWAEVREGGPMGRPMGYFFAPVEEYRQSHGPWLKQLSVMILAAAERQAIRQATPLSGVMVEGEDLLVSETEALGLAYDGAPAGERGDETSPLTADDWQRVLDVVRRIDVAEGVQDRLINVLEAIERASPGYCPPANVEMLFSGIAPEQVTAEIERLETVAERLGESIVTDAEIVGEGSNG